jgi:hypothetical protein
MIRTHVRRAWLLAPVLLAGATALALEPPPAEVAAAAEQAAPPAADAGAAAAAETVDASAILKRMADFLANAESFTVTIVSQYDSVQRDGQKIEFGESRRLALARPNRLRVDSVRADGERRGLVFNGKKIAAFDLDKKVYASVDKEGTVDEALDYLVDDLDMRVPLAELFSTSLPETLTEGLDEASFVEVARTDGVPCDHIAARGDDIDVQLWIERGERPVPRRVVISYREARGEPQFRADLLDWDLAPGLEDANFAFAPAEGAEQIPFAPQVQPEAGAGAAPAEPAAGSAP